MIRAVRVRHGRRLEMIMKGVDMKGQELPQSRARMGYVRFGIDLVNLKAGFTASMARSCVEVQARVRARPCEVCPRVCTS